MVATPLRLGNDVIDCHVPEREMGPTPIAQPLLLSIERVFMRSVVRESFGGTRDVCAVNDRPQNPFTLIKPEFSLKPVPNQLHCPW